MRSVAVDYSGESGAPLLMAIVDEISGGGEKVWQWQLPKLDGGSANVRIEGRSFVIARGDATLTGTLVAPSNVKLRVANGEEATDPESQQKEKVNLNALHATGGDNFFVVMTLQRGEPPKVAVGGTGLKSKVTIGRQNISFDGEKIVLSN
jgi:hypothetical protein